MRMTAPVIGGAAIALAVALVWFFQWRPEPNGALESESTAPSEQTAARSPRSASAPPPVAVPAPDVAPSVQPSANTVPTPERSPLPGEAPTTPMAQALAAQQQNLIIQNREPGLAIPPEMAEGEREFAAEPIDGTWAPGAEASLLSTFAQVPGLELVDLQVHCRSTMCRVQLSQSIAVRADAKPPFKIADQVDMKPRWIMTVFDGAAPARPPQPGDPPLPLKSIAYLWRDGFAPEPATRAADDPN